MNKCTIKEIHIDYQKMYEELNKRNEEFETILATLKGEDELSTKNLVSIDDLTFEDIKLIFRITWPFKAEFISSNMKKIPLLKGKSVINFFFETSTRTRVSFELAGKHLSADTINVSGSGSSMSKKGETLNDTARTLNALYADLIILRHGESQTPRMVANEITVPVISAGDGCNEHPTQALLDAFTICEKLQTIKDKKILIIGDVLHSRVAGSLIRIVKKMNGHVKVCAPPTMVQQHIKEAFDVDVTYDLDSAIQDCDVAYSLRVQTERAANGFIPTIREYSKRFGINKRRLALGKPGMVVMHPGPVNREVDLTTGVLESDQCLVEEQVTNGFCTRLALLYLMVKGNPGKWRDKPLETPSILRARQVTQAKIDERGGAL